MTFEAGQGTSGISEERGSQRCKGQSTGQKVGFISFKTKIRFLMISRRASAERDTIDLHGLTFVEAIVIVTEELEETVYSQCRGLLCFTLLRPATDFNQARPLKIITGRGTHSVNHVSVLKPRIREALSKDGWSVGVWEGGVIVRGRRADN